MSKALHSAYTLHGKTLKNILLTYTLTQFKDSRLPPSTASVVTCVGVWVVTEWSVSCLSNSQVITKS